MENIIKPGEFVELTYDLYTVEDGKEVLRHQVSGEDAERFIFGVTPNVIPALEKAVEGLKASDDFTVTLTPETGFGQYDENLLHREELPKEIFEVDGKLDSERVYAGAHIYLQTNVGQEVPATVVEVGDKTVTVMVDFNHPMAGKTVVIKGQVKEVRTATPDEIAFTTQAGQCGCGSCGDGQCGDGCGCGDGQCSCG